MPRLLLAVFLLAGTACVPFQSRTELTSVAPRPSAKPAEAVRRIRVGSYNTWLLPIASMELDTRRAKMPDALAALQLDILCLQEVWLEPDRTALAAALAPVLPHAAASSGGLLTLSRWPIRTRHFEKLPASAGLGVVEQLAGKGILDAVVATPWGDVRVINSHLALANGPVAKAARQEQLIHLLDYVAERRDVPVIIGADLNVRSVDGGAASADYRTITEKYGLRDGDPPGRTPEGHLVERAHTRVGWPRHGGMLYHWAPDVILYNGASQLGVSRSASGRALDTPETALSDHNLMWAELLLHPPRTPVR